MLPVCVVRVNCGAPGVTGKSEDWVAPPTYAFPLESAAIAAAASCVEPPRKVEYTIDGAPDFVVSNRATNVVLVVFFNAVWKTPAVTGKSVVFVLPVTKTLELCGTAIAVPMSPDPLVAVPPGEVA